MSVGVAVDVGGTFTDIVMWDGARLKITKTDTTPGRLTEGVLTGIRELSRSLAGVDVLFHGTTVIINALLEAHGAHTALVTTAGYRDVLEIARGTRFEPFDFLFERDPAFVRRRDRIEIAERMGADGLPVQAPDEPEIERVVAAVERSGARAVAVSLVNAYVNGEHEERIAAAIRQALPDVPVTASHELVREWREYERSSTAVMNAYVSPLMEGYVDSLVAGVESMDFDGIPLMMQSSGGSLSLTTAREMPIAMVESGPASGMLGAARLSDALGMASAVGFDMGGTTAKASLIRRGAIPSVRPYYVGRSSERGGWPSLFPVTDIIEIGAGGGSIARVRSDGGLSVGPESAGAEPGPVCYARGGTEPTVTDANVVLGRIPAAAFLGGARDLDLEGARQAIEERVARPLGLDVETAALGIIRIVNNSMALAVRRASLERGEDPRSLSLIAFGGSGPGHAAEIAQDLSIPRVVVPPVPENFSAFGMLLTDIERRITQTLPRSTDGLSEERVRAAFSGLREDAEGAIAAESRGDGRARDFATSVEMRYAGQERTLEVEVDLAQDGALDAARSRFHAAHRQRYGFAAESEPVEVVTLIVTALERLGGPSVTTLERAGLRVRGAKDLAARRSYLYLANERDYVEVDVLERAALRGDWRAGPLLVQEYGATGFVPEGWTARLDDTNNILLEARP